MNSSEQQPPAHTPIRIGTFGRPHGVRGELRLWLDNLHSDTLEEGIPLRTKTKGDYALLSIRYSKKFAIIRLEGVDSREDAQALTNLEVLVDRIYFPEIDEEDTFYQIDMIGLPVFDTEGKEIGFIAHFLEGLATDVAEIKTQKGTLLVPWVGHIVLKIDLDEGVTIAPLDTWTAEEEE